jgi:hypothetical protein
MKTRIEEAAMDYSNKAMGNMSPKNDDYGISHYNLVKGFIAGAEFMQKELNEKLIRIEGIHNNYVNVSCELYEKLKAQNEIMRETLEVYRLMGVGNTIADEALKKVGEG